MSFQDTPDWLEGVVSPQQLLGAFASTLTPETIALPPNAETIAFFDVGIHTTGFPTVTGVTTGVNYPVFNSPLQTTSALKVIYYCPVLPAVDAEVTITWGGLSGNPWWCVADAGVRVTYDAVLANLLGISGGAAPNGGLIVGGIAGGDYEALAVDSGGHVLPPPSVCLAEVFVANGGTVLAAPSSGAYWITGFDYRAAAADTCLLNQGGTPFGSCYNPNAGQVAFHEFSSPVRITAAITYTAVGVNQNAAIYLRGYAGP